MAYQLVDTGGFFLLGTEADPDSLFDGTGVDSGSLSRETDSVQKQCIGDSYKQDDVTGRQFQIQGDVTLPTTNTGGLFAVGDTVYATYKSQGATPTTLFAGDCIVKSISDRQAQGDYYSQSISLSSTGEPDTPS